MLKLVNNMFCSIKKTMGVFQTDSFLQRPYWLNKNLTPLIRSLNTFLALDVQQRNSLMDITPQGLYLIYMAKW